MDESYFILFGIGLGLFAFLLAMLYPLTFKTRGKPAAKNRGSCPLCKTVLQPGEKLRSNVTEIGDVEIQTWIKGCPHCLGVSGRRKRTCPVCKRKVDRDSMILAVSDPRIDRKKLGIRGCKNCYPQAF